MSDEGSPRCSSRRRFVIGAGRLATACCAAPLLTVLPGCDESPPEVTGPLRVPLATLPFGVRTRYMHGDRPIELYRDFEGIHARSLLCTHQGCNVRWLEDEQIYLCPCHDGKFDPAGKPVFGPPTAPLRMLDVTVTDTEVIVGG